MTRIRFRQLAAAAALLAVFSVRSSEAQQPATLEKVPGAAADAAPANWAPTLAQVSVAGAPTLGFRGVPAVTATAATAPSRPDAQPVTAAPRPFLDPVTHAPFSPAQRETAEEGASVEESMLASDGSLHQGLKVHGHWVIDVSNPDGTLVQHREFENSLSSTGQGFLVGLLSGYMVPGDWMIVLGPQSGNGACNLTYEFCGMVRSAATYPAQGYCNKYYCTGSTLSYAYNFGTGFNGPYSIVLTGSITANQTGTVGTVDTVLGLCSNGGYSATVNPGSIETGSPASCVPLTNPTPWYGPFTGTNITPIPVSSGQLIQAVVTITFS